MAGRRRQNGSKQNARKTPKNTQDASPAGNLFAFTVDVSTGAVVTVESLDAEGTRHKVPARQQETLAREGRERLETVLEKAFEAGINCVLGDQPEAAEGELDPKLRHDLIAPLMQESVAARRLKSEVLQRAMIGTLIQNSINSPGVSPGNA